MSHRTYFYCRVSTAEQTTKNQVLAFKNHGYDVDERFVIHENVSGYVSAMDRKEFQNLFENKLMDGDTLVVLKLDRLGRDNIDVQNTINRILSKGIKLHCLDLPSKDLSSPEGRLMLQLLSSFAEFERNRIRERTLEGQARARSEGKVIGRPPKVTPEKVAMLRTTNSISKVGKLLGVSASTVKRLQSKYKQNLEEGLSA
ncbi:recombinase family protein [Pseudoalteromonas sp. ACER1]|jgi:putative DNA-invertase from lambdoid prophage Rac|uniref:recombinase family protein n=1 Tax=unclassified Pseudoalteromonas TaxID=194690 RepID=UPI001F1AED97|nr:MULTISPECIES: recombinase family protein [unclassified Pseudoalteromonas]MCF2849181.1 recombinase family protein [Pseudoalteromonas sp. PAST1]MCO7212655.1 recombinase family protein [Pseudoalteromonas sp. ACER1]